MTSDLMTFHPLIELARSHAKSKENDAKAKRQDAATAAELTSSVGQALPNAFAWPVTAYHSITGKGTGEAAK